MVMISNLRMLLRLLQNHFQCIGTRVSSSFSNDVRRLANETNSIVGCMMFRNRIHTRLHAVMLIEDCRDACFASLSA